MDVRRENSGDVTRDEEIETPVIVSSAANARVCSFGQASVRQ